MTHDGQQLTTRLDADGTLTLSLDDRTWDAPTGSTVLVRMEAAPINPSDLGLLFAAADVENAEYSQGRIVAQMPEKVTNAMAARHGKAMPAGNEGAGTVVAAGDDPAAQALMGKRVACVPGTAYGTYATCDAAMAMPLDDDITAEQAASSFVNPMTSLGFVETMKAEGAKGIIHAAAASNLGQMLLRICLSDGIPIINIVRSDEQAELLREIGATHVIDMTDDDFRAKLKAAIDETGIMLGFDPIGGGKMADTMLAAMEASASDGQPYNRYGSSEMKKVFIYGALDTGPTYLSRGYGFSWDVSGWLLFPFLQKAGQDVVARMRGRVMDELTSTFASHYSDRITLDDMLSRDAVLAYNRRATGRKFLVLPND
ncbi:zinc-binding dehydrogenase [Croceicoccus mobilis]|uniref:NADH oxidoreductase n=1 Tax=Croceicoccus mobilis TaxID=1703339 RepID=A0A916Z5L9_9SPHN|nr:zinc-binding dehydrogenase [Croceicoccus mobilis]GGD77582.1 NADH oxidoreductase [Croceicoccus mobilis]